MDIAIYQNNTGSAPAVHWWLSQEINIGPKLYNFDTGYCRPTGHHVGAIVIEDEEAEYNKLHTQSLALLEQEQQGVIDVMSPFDNVKNKYDFFLWSNYTSNLTNPDNIIKADKTILVDNSLEEQLFFYISQYAFVRLEFEDDVVQQTQSWANQHNHEQWKEVWYNKYHDIFLQAYKDKKLKYMWQLNFAHHDLMDQLEKGKDDIALINADDHERLFEVKKQEEDFTDTLFAYANAEVDHIVVGDNWFEKYNDILDYTGILETFRLKKYVLDYTRLYNRRKQMYFDKFSKYL
jgi:hypothetical protein